MKVCFMGLGYIGLPTAIIAAKHGVQVTGVDINPKVVEMTNQGKLHIIEPGMEEYLQEVVKNGMLKASTTPEVSDAYFIVVPTPFKGNHEPDISYVESATRAVLPLLKEGDLYVIESTSPVGTTDKMKDFSLVKDALLNIDGVKRINETNVKLGEGRVVYEIEPKGELFYKLLSELSGDNIGGEFELMSYVKELNVDLMSMSSHKIYGPKGVGALYIKNGLRIDSIITGGHQERMKRGGTTNVAGVVGFAKAFEIANNEREQNYNFVSSLRDRFIDRVLNEVPYTKLNGPRQNRLPANADFSFEYIEGESILFSLDLNGIAVSSGSACSSGSLEPSHVLLSIGVPIELAHGSIRFSFGKHNTIEQIDYAVEVLKSAVDRLRNMSPLFNCKGEIKNV